MRKSKMNSENFYFSNASKTDLGKKISRLYLIGNISKEEYTDKIRKMMSKRYQVADIIDYWNKDADAFIAKSKKYYLYR